MNDYALTIVFKTELEEKKRKELLDLVTKKFGELKKEDAWGNRDLAYPIKHLKKGYYMHYEFAAEPATVNSLDKNLKIEEDIIQYLLVRV